MPGFVEIAVVLWSVLAVLVAGHAMTTDRNALLWFVLVFVFGVFGVVAYSLSFAVRSSGGDDARPVHPSSRTFPQRMREQESLIDAVEAYIREHGVATRPLLQEEFYRTYPLGYDSETEWWREFLRPQLEARERFVRVEDVADGWRLAPDDE